MCADLLLSPASHRPSTFGNFLFSFILFLIERESFAIPSWWILTADLTSYRNAIGAYGGPYSIYRALAVAMGDLPADVNVKQQTPRLWVINSPY